MWKSYIINVLYRKKDTVYCTQIFILDCIIQLSVVIQHNHSVQPDFRKWLFIVWANLRGKQEKESCVMLYLELWAR